MAKTKFDVSILVKLDTLNLTDLSILSIIFAVLPIELYDSPNCVVYLVARIFLSVK